MRKRKRSMRKTKGSNKIGKPVFLFLFLCYGINLFSQHSIKDEESVLTKKELESLQKVIDYQLEFYNKAFPDSAMKKSSVKLNVFNNYIDYLVYQKEQFGDIRHRSSGYYFPKNKEVVVCKDKFEWYFLNSCYHELSHFFLRSRIYNAQYDWLNEGLAVYFENIEVSKSIKHKRDIYWLARMKTMLELKDFNLKDFIDWSREKFYDISLTHDGYGYALGYCMVSFLMQKEETMIAVINNIYKGKSNYEALDNAYEGGFAAFEKDFIRSMGKLKSLKINPDFIYSLPVKSGDSTQVAPQKNSNGFTLLFDLSSAGDTIYACREGSVYDKRTSKEDMINNRIIIKHKDDSFSEYVRFEKSLVSQGNSVKLGQPIAVNTGETLPKAIAFAVYYVDENKVRNRQQYKCSHIIPVFHTRNAGDIKLEENAVYIGEMNEYLISQELREKEKKKYETNKKK